MCVNACVSACVSDTEHPAVTQGPVAHSDRLASWVPSPVPACSPAPAHEEQQVPDSEQAVAGPAGKECHASDAGCHGQRGFLAFHPALLEAEEQWGQCEDRAGLERSGGAPGHSSRADSVWSSMQGLDEAMSNSQRGRQSQREAWPFPLSPCSACPHRWSWGTRLS